MISEDMRRAMALSRRSEVGGVIRGLLIAHELDCGGTEFPVDELIERIENAIGEAEADRSVLP